MVFGRAICRVLRHIRRDWFGTSVVVGNILFFLWHTGMFVKLTEEDAPVFEDGPFNIRQNSIPTSQPGMKKGNIFQTASAPAVISDKKVTRLSSPITQSGDVTVVTSFLNIGRYYVEEEDMMYHPRNFKKWMKIFKRIQNPVVAYFDDDKYINIFKAIRSKFPEKMTKIVKVDRSNLWAFRLHSGIQNIFQRTDYPQHNPETTSAEFTCNLHSKYEFIDMAISSNPFGSSFYAWLDISTFRNIVEYRNKKFKIIIPIGFFQNYIGFTLIGGMQRKSVRAQDVVEQKLRLVDSQFFIGKAGVLQTWVRRYKQVVQRMMRDGWIGGDEQVIYFMAHPGGQMTTKLHTFIYLGNNPTMKHVYLAYFASTLDKCEYDLSCTW